MKRNFTFSIFLLFFLSAFLQITAQKVRVIDNKGTLRNLNRVTVADTPHADPVAGDIWFDTNPTGSEPVPTGYNKAYEVKIYDSTGNWRRLVDNIYNKNSYLTSPRTVDGKGNSLAFQNINQYRLNARKIDFNAYVQPITLNPVGYKSGSADPNNYGIIAEGPFWGKKAYRDSDGDAGTNNQILSSVEIGVAPNTERGTNWVNASSLIKGDPGSVFFAGDDQTITERNDQFFWYNIANPKLFIGNRPSSTTALNNASKLNVAGATRTQGVSNSNGTARVPSYRFTEDSDTGMFRAGTNQIGFSTNETKRLNISNSEIEVTNNLSVKGSYKDSNGNSGTDSQILSSTATGTKWINNTQVTTNNTGLQPINSIEGDVWYDNFNNKIKLYDGTVWRDFNSINNWSLTGNTATNPATNFLGTTDANALILKSNNVEKIKLHETKGQVLINGAASFNDHPFVIKANGPDILAFQDASGTPKWHWNMYGGQGLNFVESGVADYRLFLKEGGNVGIGTSNPTKKLDVDGEARIRIINNSTSSEDKILVADSDGIVKNYVGPKIVASGKVRAGTSYNESVCVNCHNASVTTRYGGSGDRIFYEVRFPSSLSSSIGNNYVIQLTMREPPSSSEWNRHIYYYQQTNSGFNVKIADGRTTSDKRKATNFMFTVISW